MASSIANLNVRLTANISAFASAMASASRPLARFGGRVTLIEQHEVFGGYRYRARHTLSPDAERLRVRLADAAAVLGGPRVDEQQQWSPQLDTPRL